METSGPSARAGGEPRGRVTLQVIADKLAVSTATVSLALRDAPVVAGATRLKVQSLARELGYSYNRSAASLRTARSNMLAVGFHDITNPCFSELLAAIEDAATEHGRTVLLGIYAENLGRQDRVLTTLREYRPDGMILCPADGTTADAFDHLTAAGIPVVQVAREVEGAGLDFVGSDDARGTALAVEHLVRLGHRRVAMIGGTDGVSTGRARHRSYRETLRRLRLPLDPALVREGPGTRETGLEAIRTLLALATPPTAAVCFNDLTAFGAMLGLRHLGLEAGRDFSLVGCDDVKEAALWYPGLTTVHNNHALIGRRAAEVLIARIEASAEVDAAAPYRELIEPSLVVRGSAQAV